MFGVDLWLVSSKEQENESCVIVIDIVSGYGY
jgi:hypothetical protein